MLKYIFQVDISFSEGENRLLVSWLIQPIHSSSGVKQIGTNGQAVWQGIKMVPRAWSRHKINSHSNE